MEITSLSYHDFLGYKNANRDDLEALKGILRQPKNPRQHHQKLKQQQMRTNWLLGNQCDDKMNSEFIGTLNKISKNNWEELSNTLRNMNINTKDNMNKLVNLIFSKAISEPKFCELYVMICNNLEDMETEDTNFKKLLLIKCQDMFKSAISMDKELENRDDDDEPSTFKFKENIIGCMVFIGGLYNIGLIEDKIISSCFLRILMNINLKKAYGIENMCNLMKVVGKKYSVNCPKDMDKYMEQIDELICSDIEVKDKFALMDIIEQRDRKSVV